MLIFLADLNYLTEKSISFPVPLNIAYIAAYISKHTDVEIKLFKHPLKLLEAISEKKPDILGLSNYMWNSNLNIAFGERIKNIKIIMGGPNFPLDKDKQEEFFRNRPWLDHYIEGAGEHEFLEYILGKKLPVPELKDIPSPYLTGWLDEFLDDEKFDPIIETHRGCPYSCEYCNWGHSTLNKTTQFPTDRVLEELEYICSRAKNPAGLLRFTDGNFGLFKRDIEIAKKVIECHEKGFPKLISVYADKQAKKHTIETFDILRPVTNMDLSLQSVNEKTLQAISRKNISFDRYIELLKDDNVGQCDLLFGLPEENYESFLNGLRKIYGIGQENVIIYSLVLLSGAKASCKLFRDKYKIKTAFRYQIDGGGTYGDINSIEYEEIVIGTDVLPVSDYFKFRRLQFFNLLFKGFLEIRHYLRVRGINLADFIEKILEDSDNWPKSFKFLISDFNNSVNDEITSKPKIKFTKDDVKDFLNKEIRIGPYFLCKLLSQPKLLNEFKNYLSKYLPSILLEITFDKIINYDKLQNFSKQYPININRWLSSSKNIEDFEEDVEYQFILSDRLKEAFKKAEQITDNLPKTIYLTKYKFYPYSEYKVFFYNRIG